MLNGIRLVTLAIAGFLLALGLLEAGIRAFVPQQLIVLAEDVWRPDPLFGYRHHENANTTVNLGERTVRFVTDDLGFRIGAADGDSASDQAILMLGDSFVEGLQVEQEETVGGRIGLQLRERGMRVRVDNAGVSGWTPNHYLLEARRSLNLRSYDLGVVCLYVGNDVVSEAVSSFPPRQKVEQYDLEIPPSLEWIEIVHAVVIPINDYLERRSHLFVFLRTRLRSTWPSLWNISGWHPTVFDLAESKSRRWMVTTTICSEIAATFRERSIPVLFVLIPTHYQVDEDLWQDHLASVGIAPASADIRQPNRLLQHHFVSAGLTLLDPLDWLKEQGSDDRLYGAIDPHLNRAGYQALAEFILPHVVAALSASPAKD